MPMHPTRKQQPVVILFYYASGYQIKKTITYVVNFFFLLWEGGPTKPIPMHQPRQQQPAVISFYYATCKKKKF